MTQLLLIGVFVVVLVHDVSGVAAVPPVKPWVAGALVAGSMLVIWLASQAYVWRCARRLDREGRAILAWRAERAVSASRVLATIVHGASVAWLGWLEAVRSLTGDLVLVDEMICVLPPIAVFVAGWASLYPIDRRMREAMMIRSLDEGRPIVGYVPLGSHVMSFVRHQLALVCVPVLLVLGWAETVSMVGVRLWDVPRFVTPDRVAATERELALRAGALTCLQLAGALVIFALVPVLLRFVWRTQVLEEGELRRDLLEMCRVHGVRVRQLLVWKTHGVLVNGAVMGLVGWMRYVLLSDGLLMGLSRREVEAVAAHEVGHIRRHHIPWLAGAVLSVLVLLTAGLDWGVRQVRGSPAEDGSWVLVIGLLALGGTIVAFGWVSRRFEWQADAFAAQHLSGARPSERDHVVTDEATEAMVGALAAVARLNHIPRHARSFRHGSIARRQARLAQLAGQRADRLAIDRQVARIKVAILIGVLLTAGLIGVDVMTAMG